MHINVVNGITYPKPLTFRCPKCKRCFSQAKEAAYADLDGMASKSYRCQPCAMTALNVPGIVHTP
jgi:hypothetical protein